MLSITLLSLIYSTKSTSGGAYDQFEGIELSFRLKDFLEKHLEAIRPVRSTGYMGSTPVRGSITWFSLVYEEAQGDFHRKSQQIMNCTYEFKVSCAGLEPGSSILVWSFLMTKDP